MFLLDEGAPPVGSAGTEQSGAVWRVGGMRIICYLFVGRWQIAFAMKWKLCSTFSVI